MLYEVHSSHQIEHSNQSPEQENQKRIPNPLEEEVSHFVLSINAAFQGAEKSNKKFKFYSFNWKTVDLENTTPPPRYPIFFV